ncbi:Crp/Fnr family transcriptional regulator [Chloroflexota bacterium]
MEKTEVLKKSELFNRLDEKQLNEIANMCEAEVFEAGQTLYKQDKFLEKIYVIQEGLVAIILEVGPMAQRQVQSASVYEVVGWSAVLEPHIATATVKALEKTTALSFKGEDLADLCFVKPEIGCRVSRGLARVIAKRLRQAYIQLLGVCSDEK